MSKVNEIICVSIIVSLFILSISSINWTNLEELKIMSKNIKNLDLEDWLIREKQLQALTEFSDKLGSIVKDMNFVFRLMNVNHLDQMKNLTTSIIKNLGQGDLIIKLAEFEPDSYNEFRQYYSGKLKFDQFEKIFLDFFDDISRESKKGFVDQCKFYSVNFTRYFNWSSWYVWNYFGNLQVTDDSSRKAGLYMKTELSDLLRKLIYKCVCLSVQYKHSTKHQKKIQYSLVEFNNDLSNFKNVLKSFQFLFKNCFENYYDEKSRLEVKNYGSLNLNKTNLELSKRIYDMLTEKYYWRNWFVIVAYVRYDNNRFCQRCESNHDQFYVGTSQLHQRIAYISSLDNWKSDHKQVLDSKLDACLDKYLNISSKLNKNNQCSNLTYSKSMMIVIIHDRLVKCFDQMNEIGVIGDFNQSLVRRSTAIRDNGTKSFGIGIKQLDCTDASYLIFVIKIGHSKPGMPIILGNRG